MGRVGMWRGARAVLCALILVLVQIFAWYPSPVRAMEESASVRVPVLVYHNVDYSGSEFSVTPEQLDEQCRWLIDNGYTSITVWQFWDAAMGYGVLPVNPVLLTNDDGWSSVMTFAEILGRYGLVGNYFLNNVLATDSGPDLDACHSLVRCRPTPRRTRTSPRWTSKDSWPRSARM